jgi:hypothetical protein
MKRYLILFYLVLLSLGAFSQEKEAGIIADYFKTGDVSGITSYFPSSIDMTIVDTEDVFSKVQASQILTQFFKTNEPKTFSVKHSGSSKGGDYYQIGTLTTNKGTYRVTFFLKKDKSRVVIKRLKIEANEGSF